jgi:hypothetical protein
MTVSSGPSKSFDNPYSEKEIAERRDATIKRMLNTPPKPHSEMKIGKRRAKSKKSLAKNK